MIQVSYAVYLAEEGGNGFRLPVNPETIEIKQETDHRTETVIKIGEVVIPGLPRLRRISWSSFWPRMWYPFLSAEPLPPDWYFDRIEQWRSNKTTVQFIVNGPKRYNISVQISLFDVTDDVGYEGEPKYKIELIEYRHVAPKKAVVKAQTAATAAAKQQPKRPDTREKSKTYTMKPGDSLWAIAQRIYGDGRKYTLIQKANGIKDADLRRLPVGKVLVIP